jgi:hypothetical protein
VGAPLRLRQPDAYSGPPGSFDAFGTPGHARQAAKTLWQIARQTERQPLRQSQVLSGDQKGCLSQLTQQVREFCYGDKAHRKTTPGYNASLVAGIVTAVAALVP